MTTTVNRMKDWLTGFGRGTIMCRETIVSIFSLKPEWRNVVYQMYFIGVKSQAVVIITGAFTGMVLCAQAYFQFHKIKMDTATLAMVSVAMVSQLGPVLTSLMVSGRVGAAITAEIGTMRVTEQVDALRTLAAHPIDYLIVPRFLAMFFAMPLLTAESVCVGIGSAYILAVYFLHIDQTYLWYHMLHYTNVRDIVTGIIKSSIFGLIIVMTSCHKGLSCRDGAEGVGQATTEAVVFSSIGVLISNFFLTMLLNRLIGQP